MTTHPHTALFADAATRQDALTADPMTPGPPVAETPPPRAPDRATTRTRRCWHVVAGGLVAALAAVPAAPASSSAKEPPPRACLWEPAAAVLAFGPELAATVRMAGAEVEILHRVTCTDHTERWLWMPSSYNGSPSN